MELRRDIPPFQSEEELIEAARNGEEKAFAFLVSRYRISIFHLILRIVKSAEDAEDLTFITFSKAFRHIDKYQPTHAFSTWLFKIASNTAIDFLRKKRLQTISLSGQVGKDENEPMENYLANKVLSETPNPEEEIIHKQRADLVHQLVSRLDNAFAKVIELRFFKEYSYEEIAEELQLPLGTVKVQIHRAKKILYEMVKNSSPNL